MERMIPADEADFRGQSDLAEDSGGHGEYAGLNDIQALAADQVRACARVCTRSSTLGKEG